VRAFRKRDLEVIRNVPTGESNDKNSSDDEIKLEMKEMDLRSLSGNSDHPQTWTCFTAAFSASGFWIQIATTVASCQLKEHTRFHILLMWKKEMKRFFTIKRGQKGP